ncbi:DGQHR domain protein [Chlorobaculum parvum NCIB 8327]|uniref:DGQHR domain protein n=1 Tax=Chlorobaculum parvum (strain DSM 263 / NCIMB 8327) TaxID=517417 RepID=B3QL14_CHLP8|nr:DGQHR domain-containing protein [Chlorobaculum parvum]ACF10802.1 DGQHR domain protein [Chlorobaculum parvum NCIB 8327]
MQKISFKCLKCKQPIGEFYIGILNHEDLIKITYADIRRLDREGSEQREVEIYTGIQRELSKNRVKEIGKYVNMVDATFPTGVIIHIDEKNILEYNAEKEMMTIPFSDNIAKVLDGQHRIAGLEEYAKSDDSFQISVTIFVGMELEDQAIVFATINKTQTKVNKSLVADLFEFATHRSPHKTAHNIVRALNQKEGSPFKDKIKILGTADDKEKETITQATFSESLMKLYSKDLMSDRDTYKRGNKPNKFDGNELLQRPLRNIFVNEDDILIAKIIWEYFKAIETKWPVAWKQVKPEMILNKSTGFIALMNLFRDLYVKIGRVGELVLAEEYLKYLNKVTLESQDFNRANFIPGSGGQSSLYKKLKEQIGI